VTLVSDYGPGIDAEKAFSGAFTKAGGQAENLRVPLANPDFSPFLQKVADAKPDALFVFVPSGVGAQFMKQFVERGLDKGGIKLIATGDVTDDDILNGMGDVALGTITTHYYSAAHDSPENKAFVEAFKKANNGLRPNFMAVGGYDGMHLIYEGLKKTNGQGGQALVDAMKGMSWTSPRGPCRSTRRPATSCRTSTSARWSARTGNSTTWSSPPSPNVKDPVKAAKAN
jgi:branched-chain amino acid transport system substrate-binding protein